MRPINTLWNCFGPHRYDWISVEAITTGGLSLPGEPRGLKRNRVNRFTTVRNQISRRLKPGRLPPGLPFWHPLALFCTWFGSGLLPKLPASWGSAAALPFAAVIQWVWGSGGLALGAALVFVAGSIAAGRFARMAGIKDPGAIVVDEVAAQWAVLTMVPLDPLLYVVSFLLFRIADVTKPWPASWCDKRLTGGLGVMADDMVAGLYAAVVLFLLLKVLAWL